MVSSLDDEGISEGRVTTKSLVPISHGEPLDLEIGKVT
jgi:hypothetical protein